MLAVAMAELLVVHVDLNLDGIQEWRINYCMSYLIAAIQGRISEKTIAVKLILWMMGKAVVRATTSTTTPPLSPLPHHHPSNIRSTSRCGVGWATTPTQ